mmetsp:Transcript_17154/g.24906  ORF Transcript_17154/g.24906 Transcript_17154/m.24906 type:complete len:704 (-) Transcript_17154:383-2494(-)
MELEVLPLLEGSMAMDLGSYSRPSVSNVNSKESTASGLNKGRAYFDLGLRHVFAYQHEQAARCFLACLSVAPDCALAHAMVALCHGPNYNFKGDAYYDSTDYPEDLEDDVEEEGESEAARAVWKDMASVFPCQQVAARHARFATEKVESLRKINRRKRSSPSSATASYAAASKPANITEVETQIILAIKTLTLHPGIDPDLAEETVGRPFADFMRRIFTRFPDDPEVAYIFAESLMVLNAWSLYRYPTGEALSRDVAEIRTVLEESLTKHPHHAGLCHMYVHLCEMSSNPGKALPACKALRTEFPDAGHLIHMPTHIDVLVGDYESCVHWNYYAILADQKALIAMPDTAHTVSFYFGYIVHNYHMLVYGAILGGFEQRALQIARNLDSYLSEELFLENPDLTAYLESYAALEIHVLVRFGRWEQLLQVQLPQNPHLMLYRAATIRFARALAYANTGNTVLAKQEADLFDQLRSDPSAENRILHNNTVSDLMAVDAPMVRGEIAYREGDHTAAFALLREAVALQDGLNYDEPWGKMQPIRHALGGLLLERGHLEEAEEVFRVDLQFHPKNPWSLTGLIACLKRKVDGDGSHHNSTASSPRPSSCCQKESTKPSSDSPPPNVNTPLDDAISQTTAAPTTSKIPATPNAENEIEEEINKLEHILIEQRKSEWADFNVTAPCMCCSGKDLTHTPAAVLEDEKMDVQF